jgi:hypothetical protein
MSRFFIVLTAVVSIALGTLCEETMAHSIFKKAMEKSYPIMKVSCNACHKKGEKKTVRNDFGELFFKELKVDNVTQNWKDAKANGRDAQKAYEKETMAPLFEKALKKVKESTVPEVEGVANPDAGKTWDEMIKAEKVDGIKVDQKKKEKLEKEAAAGGSGEKAEPATE